MGKAIVLKIIGGDFDSGFPVVLQVLDERGGLPLAERSGYLPPHPHLEGDYFNWQTSFRNLTNSRGSNDWDIDPIPDNVSDEYDRKACHEFAKLLEGNMKKWLLQTVDAGWQQIREQVVQELVDNKGNVRLVIQAEPQLWKMPWLEWDILSKDNDCRDIGIGFSPVVYQKIKKNQPQPKQGAAVRILAVFGNNENIDLTPDKQAIAQLPNVELEPLEQPSAAELIQKLRDKRGWDIFFFAGHSQTKGDEGIIYINERESLEIGQFKEALKEAIRQGLQLAIFNSCDGLGLAEKLATLQLPIAIVMKEPVPDKVAQRFLTEFLTEYAAGAYLYTAVRRSQKCLEEFAEFPGCTGLPIVCQNPAEVPPTWEELQTRHAPPINIPFPQKRDWLLQTQVIVVAGIIATSLVLGVRSLGLLERLEHKASDKLMQLRSAEPLDPRLLIVTITDEDIKYLGENDPISDGMLLKVLEKLKQYDPMLIGLALFRDIPLEPGHDNFIDYLQQNEDIITACRQEESSVLGAKPPPGTSKDTWGFLDFVLDDDEIIRRSLLSMNYDESFPCKTQLSLSFKIALEYFSIKRGIIPDLSADSLQILGVNLKFLPADGAISSYHNIDGMGYQILLNYRGSRSVARQLTLQELLENKLTPEWIEDKIVLVGYIQNSNNEAWDITPYGKMPKVLIHAHQISQIIDAVESGRPLLEFWPQWGESVWIYGWAIAGGVAFLGRRHRLYRVLTGGAIAIGLPLTCLLLLERGILAPLLPTALSALTTPAIIVKLLPSQLERNSTPIKDE